MHFKSYFYKNVIKHTFAYSSLYDHFNQSKYVHCNKVWQMCFLNTQCIDTHFLECLGRIRFRLHPKHPGHCQKSLLHHNVPCCHFALSENNLLGLDCAIMQVFNLSYNSNFGLVHINPCYALIDAFWIDVEKHIYKRGRLGVSAPARPRWVGLPLGHQKNHVLQSRLT